MAIPVEEALSLWRDLERVRDQLPNAAERQLVDEQIQALRSLYGRLTADAEMAEVTLRASQAALDRAQAVLAGAHARIREAPAIG